MRYLLSLGVMVAWGLWFGGLMTLFILINAVFHALGPTQDFYNAARAVFGYFGLYQLVLASFSMMLCVFWLLAGQTQRKWLLTILIFIAAAAVVVSMTCIVPKMDKDFINDQAAFGKLHAISLMLYVGESVLLLLAGFLLPAELARDLRR